MPLVQGIAQVLTSEVCHSHLELINAIHGCCTARLRDCPCNTVGARPQDKLSQSPSLALGNIESDDTPQKHPIIWRIKDYTKTASLQRSLPVVQDILLAGTFYLDMLAASLRTQVRMTEASAA